MDWRRLCAVRGAAFGCLAALLGLAAAPEGARAADQIDAALGVEVLTDEVGLGAGRPPAAPPPAMSGASDMAAAVRSLEQALAAAQAENERLKDIVRRILQASRRERQSMYYNLGCVFRVSRQFERAEEAFLQALAIDPNDAGVHYNLGILYQEDLKMPDKAREHYGRFLELAPDDADAGQVRAWLSELR